MTNPRLPINIGSYGRSDEPLTLGRNPLQLIGRTLDRAVVVGSTAIGKAVKTVYHGLPQAFGGGDPSTPSEGPSEMLNQLTKSYEKKKK